MLFHSPEFIFGFLPACWLGFILIYRYWGWQPTLIWLAAASILFYGHWSAMLAILLVGSIVGNYAAMCMLVAKIDERRVAAIILIGAVLANLALLGYFKYTNFFIDNTNYLLGTTFRHLSIILPIGISFYTFIQIGFLVEVYNRQVGRVPFAHYFLFASFFPCVTAGPIILQRDMMPQFANAQPTGLDAARIAVALTVFAIGLFKKLVLADNIAPFADEVFDGAAAGAAVAPATAWIGALAYTLQLYFDFSGYSDMALGSAYLFGLRLPLNFNSPLKACSITDFWRRWHMTMTRFFTNYLYSPIAVSTTRRAVRGSFSPRLRFMAVTAMPVTATFVLAGLWHGAGWTFVIFGLIHGVALATNHGWREAGMPALPAPAGWFLTMIVVLVGLVFFRAENVPVALALLASMTGLISYDAAIVVTIDTSAALGWIVLLATLALMTPNTQEIMQHHWYSSDPQYQLEPAVTARFAWRPTAAWGLAGAIVLAVALGYIGGETAFLYYQF